MDQGLPELTIDGRRAVLWLRRPQRANLLGPDDLAILLEHIETVNAAEDVLVLQVRAEGNSFCAGFDLDKFQSGPAAATFAPVPEALQNARPVTMAVLQGGAYGGGTDLALACETWEGATLKDTGFLTHYCEAEAELDVLAETLGQTLASMAPLALLGMKAQINRIAQGRADPGASALAVERTEASADLKEGLKAWREKRPPIFRGV